MPVELPANEEDRAARALIEQAGKALSRRRPEISASFVAQLYGRSVPEDLVRYGADDLAALAEHAYEFRQRGNRARQRFVAKPCRSQRRASASRSR